MSPCSLVCLFFFFNDAATTEIYTLSLHDALPICDTEVRGGCRRPRRGRHRDDSDRKSTRLNSSHANISYAVFCLKKKKKHSQGTQNSTQCTRSVRMRQSPIVH